MKTQHNNLWRWSPVGAAALYLLVAYLLGFNSIGLQNDESLHQHGAVHLLTSTKEPSFVYHKGSWIYFAGRQWPLMIIPYAGAIKHYLMVVPFAVFGTDAAVGRLVSALLGALGIWGIARFLQGEVGLKAAAAVAGILAIHPAYLIHTVYDNGTVVGWMAIVGLLAVAVRRYKARGTVFSALLVGLLMGMGIWNRANFVWMLASIIAACAIVYRKKLLIPFTHLAALIAGGVIGGAPFLLYQFLSDWEIFSFMQVAQVDQSLTSILARRIPLLFETLLITDENRAIWGGLALRLPFWQSLFLSITLILSLLTCLLLKDRGDSNHLAFRRASALGFLFFALVMLTSRLTVASHHLVTIVPMAAVVVVIALQVIISRWNKAWALAASLALIFSVSALNWNLAAARGFRETGGLGSWSDAIYSVNDYIQTHYSGHEVNILDWGLKNNLYVLSYGKLTGPELFWGATRDKTRAGISWDTVISKGGVFLTNSAGNLHFPPATEGLLAALARSGYEARRVEFHQKNGRPYAEIIEVRPQLSQTVMRSTNGAITAKLKAIRVVDPNQPVK